MNKIITIVGARPQFIKMAVLSPLLRRHFKEIVLHTGQHYDREMSGDFFKELGLPRPDYNLGVVSPDQGEQVARMLLGIERVLIKEKPRCTVLYGDTNSTLAGALASAKLNIPVAHIEAGLRSFNNAMPEEINRILVDRISRFLFSPTRTAVSNLKKEGIRKNIFLVGDVMFDALRYFMPQAEKKSSIIPRMGLKPKRYYLLTIHRAENTCSKIGLERILSVMDNLGYPCIFPVHPRTRNLLGNSLKGGRGLILTPPVSYLDMLILEKNAAAIFTDSGGVQKEAYLLRVPCITLRSETEWVETLRGGCNQLLGTENINTVNLKRLLRKRRYRFLPYLFGSARAGARIARIISENI